MPAMPMHPLDAAFALSLHNILHPAVTGYPEDLAAAAAISELDLIIGGHSHTFLYTPTTAGPITDLTVANANASTCAAASACDVPSGPYPTFVDTNTGAGKTKVVPVVQGEEHTCSGCSS